MTQITSNILHSKHTVSKEEDCAQSEAAALRASLHYNFADKASPIPRLNFDFESLFVFDTATSIYYYQYYPYYPYASSNNSIFYVFTIG